MNNTTKVYIVALLLFFSATGLLYGQIQVLLSDSENVINPVNYPHFAYYPDGHISVLPNEQGYIMFWAEFESHRSIGTSQFVEDQTRLEPENAVFGRRGNFDTYDNGGSWLMSVFREEGDNLIGFFHAEDHWYPHYNNNIAWKSLGVTYSSDAGKTWSEGKQIITSPKEKPETPEWGGSGDCCVVWDHHNNRWICYYQEHDVYMAVSEDPKGAPGTWKKYYNGAFTEPGLGGEQTKVPGLTPGANPSVHWNTYLEKWVMVWHAWGTTAQTRISFSDDGITWDTPQSIIASEINTGGKAWYPTIIGETDVKAGQIARIYYADIEKNFSYRIFRARTITFIDPENISPATAQIDQPVDNYSVLFPSEIIKIKASVNNCKAAIEKAEFYSDGTLIGSDNSFPYQFDWQPIATSKTKLLKVVFTDTEGTRIESEDITVIFDYNVGYNTYKNSDLTIYPSPGRDYIVLSGLPDGEKEISIYNINQQLVDKVNLTETEQMIDIKGYKTGIYFIKVKVGNQYYRNKIIKY